MWDEIAAARNWAHAITYPNDFELFLNPADAEGLRGSKILGMPVRQSIGVPEGKCLIFDLTRAKYIRQGEQMQA